MMDKSNFLVWRLLLNLETSGKRYMANNVEGFDKILLIPSARGIPDKHFQVQTQLLHNFFETGLSWKSHLVSDNL